MSEEICFNKNHTCSKCSETKKWYGGADVCIYDGDCIHNHNDIIRLVSKEKLENGTYSIFRKPCRFKSLGYDRAIHVFKKKGTESEEDEEE